MNSDLFIRKDRKKIEKRKRKKIKVKNVRKNDTGCGKKSHVGYIRKKLQAPPVA
jgi:hypothetical protein